MFNKELREWFSPISNPASDFLYKAGIKPNHMSLLVLICGCLGAWFIYKVMWIPAFISILLSGFFDIMDGAIAKRNNLQSKFGIILDPAFDKISEFSWYVAIAFFNPMLWPWALYASNATLLSTMILHDAKKSGYPNPSDLEGFIERKDRLILVAIGTLFPQYFNYVLIIISVAATIVWAQRLWLSYKAFN